MTSPVRREDFLYVLNAGPPAPQRPPHAGLIALRAQAPSALDPRGGRAAEGPDQADEKFSPAEPGPWSPELRVLRPGLPS